MITKDQIIEQYAEILYSKDDNLGRQEALQEAKELYQQKEVSASDFNEYTAVSCIMNMSHDSLKGADPTIQASSPHSFLSVCASGLHSDCGKEVSDKELDSFLVGAIKSGVNLEGVKNQAYKRLEIMHKTESELHHDPKDYDALNKVIKFCDAKAMLSPYHELREHQRNINNFEKQRASFLGKDFAKYNECNEKIRNEEAAITDFFNNCEKNGLDREIAQEFIEDCKANLQRESVSAQQNESKKEEDSTIGGGNNGGENTSEERKTAEKEDSDNATNVKYESQRKMAAYENYVQSERRVEKVPKEEIEEVKNNNPEIDGRDRLKERREQQKLSEMSNQQIKDNIEKLTKKMDSADSMESWKKMDKQINEMIQELDNRDMIERQRQQQVEEEFEQMSKGRHR